MASGSVPQSRTSLPRRTLTLENSVAAELAGSGDSVLRALRDRTTSKVHLRGNLLTLEGEDAEMDQAARLVDEMVDAEHEAFVLRSDGVIVAGGQELAQLSRGADLLHPEVKVRSELDLAGGGQARLHRRLRAWSRDFVDSLLAPLRDERLASASAPLRGVVYQLEKHLGTLPLSHARAQTQALSDGDNELCRELGIVVGQRHVFLGRGVSGVALVQRVALCRAFVGQLPFEVPADSLSVGVPSSVDEGLCLRLGYPRVGPLAIRVDVIERVLEHLAELPVPIEHPEPLEATLGCSHDALEGALVALGYALTEAGFVPGRGRRSRRGRRND